MVCCVAIQCSVCLKCLLFSTLVLQMYFFKNILSVSYGKKASEHHCTVLSFYTFAFNIVTSLMSFFFFEVNEVEAAGVMWL